MFLHDLNKIIDGKLANGNITPSMLAEPIAGK